MFLSFSMFLFLEVFACCSNQIINRETTELLGKFKYPIFFYFLFLNVVICINPKKKRKSKTLVWSLYNFSCQ